MRSKYLLIVFLVALGISFTSCATHMRMHPRPHHHHHHNDHHHHKVKNIPPGQVKKITGSQSARDYAPGRNK